MYRVVVVVQYTKNKITHIHTQKNTQNVNLQSQENKITNTEHTKLQI
jgi:hypothetical protein